MTVAEVDAAFVEALGLRVVAADVARGLRASGLRPRPGAGLEVVARNLGLRHNYPAALDARERLPSDTAIRIDGAYAAWKVLREQDWEPPYVHDKLAGLWIPPVPAAVAGVLQRAVSEIGAPYVWGGSSLEDGGFDCSGLVLHALGGDEGWLGGRTTQEWARAHRRDRLSKDALEAGDIVMFGRRGRRSRPGAGRSHGALPRQRLVHRQREPGREPRPPRHRVLREALRVRPAPARGLSCAQCGATIAPSGSVGSPSANQAANPPRTLYAS